MAWPLLCPSLLLSTLFFLPTGNLQFERGSSPVEEQVLVELVVLVVVDVEIRDCIIVPDWELESAAGPGCIEVVACTWDAGDCSDLVLLYPENPSELVVEVDPPPFIELAKWL